MSKSPSKPEADESAFLYQVVMRRSLVSGDPALIQVHFDIAVLDRYREAGEFSVIRTETVGRVRKQGGWALDFGIAPDEDYLHVSFAQLLNLPAAEREHFASFAASLPASRTFISMRMAPGACYDDGEVRSWE